MLSKRIWKHQRNKPSVTLLLTIACGNAALEADLKHFLDKGVSLQAMTDKLDLAQTLPCKMIGFGKMDTEIYRDNNRDRPEES